MRASSHAIGICCIVLALFASASPVFAASVSAGSWQLDSDLNTTEARAVLAQLTFVPQTDAGENAWLVSSSTYLLSDGAGTIGPSAVLAPNCPAKPADGVSPNFTCASSSDLYQRLDERLVRIGRLHFSSNSMFNAPSSSAGAFSYPNNGHSNQSALSSGPDIPLTLPQEWLWVIAAGIVLVLTLAFVLRNRD